MDRLDAASRVPWMPLGISAIATVTTVGILLPAVFEADAERFDTFMSWMLFSTLSAVAVANFVVVRLITLPQMFSALRKGKTEPPPTLAQVTWSARLLSFTFSVSPAVYGLLLAILSGMWAAALPFGGGALLLLLATNTYIDGQLSAFVREARARGEA